MKTPLTKIIHKPSSKEIQTSIKIIFGLRASDPSWVGYQSEIHGIGFKSNIPILKVTLNNESFFYPYSLLSSLIINDITLEVKAEKIKDLQLYNQIGTLNSSNPFFPFGPIPNLGSYLIIGNSEAFFKSLDALSLRIQWYNLPQSSGGFKSYYEGYDLPVTNDAYEVKLAILQDGIWQPEEDNQQSFKLFQSQGDSEDIENAPLNQYTNLDTVDVIKIKMPPDYTKVNSEIEYDNLSLQGFIKLEFSNPPYAFGHQVYPTALSKVMMSRKQTIFPNQPIVPQIKSIEISYESSSSIRTHSGQKLNTETNTLGEFYHIQPFGNAQVFPNTSGDAPSFLPKFDYEGFMAIALDKLELPQHLSLLFEMYNDYAESSEQKPPEISWHYLANDNWYNIPDTKIIRDDTQSFINSGIIIIELPGEMTKGNHILDSEYYWLGIAINNHIANVSKLISISSQVHTATLINLNEEFDFLEKPLEPFSIKRPVQLIPGIQNVSQPLPSFRGKPRESNTHFYTRVSERLRHKNRASTSWDYERLILESYPDIQKVICLTDLAGSYGYSPGSLVLIVIPKEGIHWQENQWEKRVSNQLLLEIKQFLSNYISPFVQLEVRNPHYEKVKIICSVKFDQKHSFGYYIIQLNKDLNHFLTADILENQMGEELGGKIHSSDVLSFIRSLPYVEFATRFSMIQIAKGIDGRYKRIDTAQEFNPDIQEDIIVKPYLEAEYPWSKLIPTRKHYFRELDEATELKAGQAGIDTLGLDEEFVIDD